MLQKRTSVRSRFTDPRLALPALFVLGLLFRLLLLNYRYAVGFDEVNYLKLGVSAHLHGLSALLHTYWSPLLPLLISKFCALFGDYELAGRLVSVLAGSLLVFPTYFLGRLVYDNSTGLVGAVFVAFYPRLAFLSTTVLTEAVYMLLAACAVLSAWWMLKRYSTAMAFVAGFLAGLLYLTRPEGIGFLALALAWILAGAVFRLFLIRRLRAGLLVCSLAAGFFLVSLPYIFYLKAATGSWTLSAKGTANLQMDTPVDSPKPHFHGLNEENTAVRVDQIYHLGTYAKATDGGETTAVKLSMKSLSVKYVRNLHGVLRRAVPGFLTMLPLLLVGAALVGRKWEVGEGKKNIFLLSFIGFYWFGMVPLFHINERYFTSMWPLVTVWIAQGSIVLYNWLKDYPLGFKLNRKPRSKDAVVAAAVVSALWACFAFLPELGPIISRSSDDTDYWADAIEQKAAGRWLKENGVPGPVVMARNHAVSFYAGNYDIRESVTLPDNTVDRVLDYARARHVDYLVLDERYASDCPAMLPLLDGKDVPAELKLVYSSDVPPGIRTAVYEIGEPRSAMNGAGR